MKAFILTVVLLLVTAGILAAATSDPEKIGFRAYSSATSVTCQVFGQPRYLARDSNNQVIQEFAPTSAYSRTYLLGTKGFGNYSTIVIKQLRFTCTTTGASTAARVKVFLSGVESYFLTLSEGTFAILP